MSLCIIYLYAAHEVVFVDPAWVCSVHHDAFPPACIPFPLLATAAFLCRLSRPSVPSEPFRSSICPRTWSRRRLIGTDLTASSCTGCLCLGRGRCVVPPPHRASVWLGIGFRGGEFALQEAFGWFEVAWRLKSAVVKGGSYKDP